MTKESEDAAKWGIIEKYREANQRLTALASRCQEIGRGISVLGHAISISPEKVEIGSDGVTYPKFAGSPAYERNQNEIAKLSKSDIDLPNLACLLDEYKEVLKAKAEQEQKLENLGINPEGLLKG